MPRTTLSAAPLTGGVSKQPPTNRSANQMSTSDNTVLFINRGLERRYGSDQVLSPDNSDGSISLTGTSSSRHKKHTIDRDSDNRFFVFVDGGQATDADVVQVFDTDGSKKTVNIELKDGNSPLDYIRSGSGDAKNKLGATTSLDTTYFWNTEVVTALKGSAPGYSNLTAASTLPVPATGTVGHYIHLTQPDVGYPTGFWEIKATNDVGPWYERVTTDLANSEIDYETMPVKLSYDISSGEFTLAYEDWNTRKSGDSLTNPGPSFIGQAIDWVTLFQDRFWFGSGNKIVSSQSGDLFNLWVDDWQTAVDSDPISLVLPGDGANTVAFMIPVQNTLLVMADGARQYEIKAPNSFTPDEVNLLSTTSYPVSSKAAPVIMGNQVYFTSDQGRYTSLYEYFYNFDRDANLGVDLSDHIEGYLPKNINKIIPSENSNIIFCLSSDEPNVVYLNFSYWNVTEKVQNAFCRWVLDESVTIVSGEVFDNDLYLVLEMNDKYWIESFPITTPDPDVDAEGTSPYHVHMDRKVSVTGSYDSSTKRTTWTLPFKDESVNTLVLGGGWSEKSGLIVDIDADNTGSVTTVSALGDFSAHPAYVGKSYETSSRLSPVYQRDQNGQVIVGSLSLRRLITFFVMTAFFEVDIKPKGRETKKRRYVSNRLGSTYLGNTAIEEYGQWSTLVMGEGRDTEITYRSNSPLPMLITNLEFIGDINPGRTNPAKT